MVFSAFLGTRPFFGFDVGGAAYFPMCGLKCPFAGDYSCHGSTCAHVFACLIKCVQIYIYTYIGISDFTGMHT